MLRFSANLSMLFGEYDFFARFEKAAQCGFRGVEFMFPYDYDIEELKQVLASNKLEHTLHNLPAGDWAAGERGIACIPGREEEFRDGVAAAIRYARALGNKKINCLVGKTPAGFSSEQRMEGELTNTMTQWADKIGHLQIADNPHRGEPGTGEINYDYLFKVIENSDYNGWVGCEYKPQTTTEAGLRWMDPYR